MEEVRFDGGLGSEWVDPLAPDHYMHGGFSWEHGEEFLADFSWRGTTSLGGGVPASIDFDGYPLGSEPCTGERRVTGCLYGTFTHDHMNTARFYMVSRSVVDYFLGYEQLAGAFKVWITYTGTGTVRKTIGSNGTVTRTRDAVIDLRATFKDVVLVDATGLSGSFPSVTRCCV